jgi:NDP-sugar pyrophosphorylase family protein
MGDSVAGVVLAAGSGTRLRPISRWRPKALCPVGGVPLVTQAIARVAPLAGGLVDVAVNLHHGAASIDAALPVGVHRSFEQPVALGTAGALGRLRPWLDGRDVVVTNADAWFGPELDLAGFVGDWDRERVRLLCVDDPRRGDFGARRYCGVALLPAGIVERLEPVESGLYEVSWRAEHEAGRLDLVTTTSRFVDCGTPADYLRANLSASGGAPVVDPGAQVAPDAQVVRSVLWDGAVVETGERLVDAVRTRWGTVLVRAGGPRVTVG